MAKKLSASPSASSVANKNPKFAGGVKKAKSYGSIDAQAVRQQTASPTRTLGKAK